jgi:hypothetical protein
MLRRHPGRRSARRWLLASASVAAAIAGATLQPSSTSMTLDVAGGRLTVGAVRPAAGLIGAALAQASGSVTLENVTFESSSTTYRLPRIEFVGASLSRDDLARLLDPKAAEPWPSRLARLSAERIVVSSVTLEQKVGPQLQAATYRDVVASGVKAGRIAHVSSDGSEVRATGGPQGDVAGTFGRLTIDDLDLPAMVALYTDRAGDRPAPLGRVYGGFSMENLAVGNAAGPTFKIARASGREFLARPTRDGWDALTRALDVAGDRGQPTPAAGLKQLGVLADFYEAAAVGSVELSGLEVRDGRPGAGVAMTVGRMAYTGAASGQLPEFRLEDMAFSDRNGGGRIGRIGFTGFSFASTAEGLRALADKPVDQLGPDALRPLVPLMGTVRISDLDVDAAPSAEGRAPKSERVRFGVRSIALTADKPVNGVPTDVSTTMENVTVPLPEASTDDTLQRLLALGYRTLDLSFASAATWTEPANELQIRELSLRGAEMGAVTLRGVVGGVTKDAFASDSAVAAVAWLGASARSLELTVEDRGLAERLLALEARRQKTSPEDLRRAYGAAAAIGVPAVLGNSAQAKAVAQAVARFLAKPGRLTITAKAKDPAGVGAADFAALGDAATVLERLDVSARAD